MKKHVGYDIAINLGETQLRERNPEDVVFNTGVTWDGSNYVIPWLNKQIKLSDGTPDEQIIWLHYLLGQGPKNIRNKPINYKQVPGAAIYNDNFIKRCINPMVNAFGGDLETFIKRGMSLGGQKVSMGHAAFTLHPLPYVPLTYVLWEGDDEIPANGNILFDETAIEWLCAEDLVCLAGLPVYMMLKM